MLNLYPYAPGHLMVCPYRHIADYTETTASRGEEMSELTKTAMRVLRSVSSAEGFNVGMNQGAAGGAGIAHTSTSTSCRAGSATRTSCR